MSKYLVAPLNWGLGHASRCVPLVQRLMNEGHEVILGGDGESLTLLRKHFPKLRYTYLAPLNLRYSKGQRQVGAILRALPKLISWSIQDHAMLKALLREEHIDQVISDNRFGLYSKQTECIYITHQLHVMLPIGWKWAEGIASRLHARIYTRFNKVWVPDYADPQKSLAGELSHPKNVQCTMYNVQYIGPLSRFEKQSPITRNEVNRALAAENHQSPLYDIVAVLSGLEPHRTMLEQELVARFAGHEERVLIVQGLMHRPNTRITRGNITIVPYLPDTELAAALLGASHIIARSGFSTIMDLEDLGLLNTQYSILNTQIELIPTPGQPEQEYLATLFDKKK